MTSSDDRQRQTTSDGSGPSSLYQISTDDFDQFTAGLSRWDSRFTQFDGGKFAGRMRFVSWNRIQLFDVDLNRTLLAQGGHPAGAFVFIPIEAANAGSTWRGRSLHPGMLHVRRPGDEIDHRTSSTYASTNLIVDGSFLQECARVFIGVELEDASETRAASGLSSGDCKVRPPHSDNA